MFPPHIIIKGDFTVIHTVTKGETVYSIAAKYGVSPSVLAVNNSVSEGQVLAVGQSLAVAIPKTVYSVKAGDSVYSVAEKFGIKTDTLYANNLILGGTPALFPGQTLIIETEKSVVGTYTVGGYAYLDAPEPVIRRALPAIAVLTPFTYGFDLSGNLIKPDISELLSYSSEYGAVTVLHLSTLDGSGKFSTENATALLSDSSVWEILSDNIINEMSAKGMTGIDIDFEFIGEENASRYADFIAFVKSRISEYGYTVTVAVPPKTSDTQAGLLYEGSDYGLIGKASDFVLCMTYEWGYTYGPPLAVSPIPNVRAVLDYAVSRIDSGALFEGISNYGYDFTLPYVKGESKAVSLSTRQAVELASSKRAEILYDNLALAPYFNYTEGGKTHIVWFEDARSLYEKIRLFAEYNLKGGFIWNLDRENNSLLTVIANTVNRPVSPL